MGLNSAQTWLGDTLPRRKESKMRAGEREREREPRETHKSRTFISKEIQRMYREEQKNPSTEKKKREEKEIERAKREREREKRSDKTSLRSSSLAGFLGLIPFFLSLSLSLEILM